MPGGLRAGLERSWIGGAISRRSAMPLHRAPPAATVTGSRARFLIAVHTGVLIVEIDLTRIGPVSRTSPLGSDPAPSAPLSIAASRTAQTMAAEKTDRSRTEFLFAWVYPLAKPVARAFNVAHDDLSFRVCPLAAWQLDAGEVEDTSAGNYSGHAPTASQLRTNAANAFDAPWSDQSRSVSCQTMPSSAGVTMRSILKPSGSKPRASELISGQPNAVVGDLKGPFLPLGHLPHLRR